MKVSFDNYISIFVHRADLVFTNYVKSLLKPFNLAPEQNLIMMLLWEKDGLAQNEIATRLEKDKTNIARMVCNLEQKGFIRRETEENDRRSLRIYLTVEGKKLGDRVIPIAEEFNNRICQGISEEELNQLRKIISKMCANIQ